MRHGHTQARQFRPRASVGLGLVLAACQLTPQRERIEPPALIGGAAWQSMPDRIADAKRHTPRRITVHHAGVDWKRGEDPYRKIRALQRWGKRAKNWPDVPYHFLIAPDGRIFVGRDLAFAGETNTEYDVQDHALVQLWGNFETQRVRLAQLRSAVHLVAWLCATRGITPATIAGHRDWSKQTQCPGRDLYRYLESGAFRSWVEATLRGDAPEIAVGPALPGGPTVFVPVE